MARMDARGSDTVTMTIDRFLGVNNAVQFSQIDIRQSPDMLNLIPGRIGSLRHRPGTKLITDTPRVGGLARMFPFRKNNTDNIVASGDTTLYKFDSVGLEWDAQTMTASLTTGNIDAVQFRGNSGDEVLVIADGDDLKYYDGTTVNVITPAANDSSPLPPNDLATINTSFPPVGITTHNNRLVIWPQGKDTIFHSKPGYYDYFPNTNFQRWVKDNDYVQQCHSFGATLLVFMRHSIGALFGDGYSPTPQSIDWAQDFLDTTDGCVNPRSVQTVVFPDSTEQVFYQTVRGVSAVVNVNTKSLDNSSRLATRDVTDGKVDWHQLGITDAEWADAATYFTEGKYWMIWLAGSTYKGMVYDTHTDQWHPIQMGVSITDFYANEDGLYFIGTEGHLKMFDDTIHVDYTDFDQETGVPVEWYWYSKLLNPVISGFDHLWDILMIECQQFDESSTIDVEVNGIFGQYLQTRAIKTEIFIIGISIIGEAQIANPNFTDIINNAKRLRIFLKSQYVQIKLSSTRGEPVELYHVGFEVRPQVTYA